MQNYHCCEISSISFPSANSDIKIITQTSHYILHLVSNWIAKMAFSSDLWTTTNDFDSYRNPVHGFVLVEKTHKSLLKDTLYVCRMMSNSLCQNKFVCKISAVLWIHRGMGQNVGLCEYISLEVVVYSALLWKIDDCVQLRMRENMLRNGSLQQWW